MPVGQEVHFGINFFGTLDQDLKCVPGGTYYPHNQNSQSPSYVTKGLKNYVVLDYYTVFTEKIKTKVVDGIVKLPFDRYSEDKSGYAHDIGKPRYLYNVPFLLSQK